MAVGPSQPSLPFNAELGTDDVAVNIVPARGNNIFCITAITINAQSIENLKSEQKGGELLFHYDLKGSTEDVFKVSLDELVGREGHKKRLIK